MDLTSLVNNIYYLIFAFSLKHFLADYPLQTPYMLRKMDATGWMMPIVCHAAVHGALTFFILGRYGVEVAALLAVVDTIAHFLIDTLKVRALNFNVSQSAFWVALGFDQLLHYLTYLVLIYLITSWILVPLVGTLPTHTAAVY